MDEQTREEIDPGVFRRFRKGDADAACLVVERYHRPLLAFLRAHLGDRDLAEDVAQEVFLRLLEHRHTLRGPRQLASWLFTVAIRAARRQLQRGEATLPEENAPRQTGSPPVQGDRLQEERRLHVLHAALASLPEKERELLTLRYFAGLPIKDLAGTLGMPMGSVGVKIGRSLQRLRRELESSGHRLEDLL